MKRVVKKKTAAQERSEIIFIYVYFAVCALMILMDTAMGSIAYAALGITAIAVFFGQDDFAMLNLIFLMPFALIFKNSPSATSFFTYLLLLYVVKKLLYGRRFPGYIFVFFIYLAAIQIITNTFNALRSVKLIANLLFVYYAYSERESYDKYKLYIAYVLGFTIASLMAYLDSSAFRIDLYIGEIDYAGENARYSGLNADANFYSVNVVTALCLLIHLYQKKKLPNLLMGGIAAILVFCAINTYSKSVLLMMMFPVYLFMWINHKEKKVAIQLLLISGIVIFAINLVAGKIDALSVVMGRLESGEGDLDALTTGRTRLWRIYMGYYSEHPLSTLFGFGLGANLQIADKGAHNIYIDMVYYLGIIGEIWIIMILDAISKERRDLSVRRRIIHYSVNIVIAIMYFFLPGLFDYQLPILLLLGFLVLEGDAAPLNSSITKRNSGRRRYRSMPETGTAAKPKVRITNTDRSEKYAGYSKDQIGNLGS